MTCDLTRVLGVDPGSHRTGWGIVERVGGRTVALAAGVVRMDRNAPLADRLRVIFEALSALIEQHRPTSVAVEDIFYAKHAQAALKLGHARGAALVAASVAGLAVTAYPPAVVKRAIAGRGSADKEQVSRIVAQLLGLKELPPVDATDALSVAITHLNSRGLLAAAVSVSRPRTLPKRVALR